VGLEFIFKRLSASLHVKEDGQKVYNIIPMGFKRLSASLHVKANA